MGEMGDLETQAVSVLIPVMNTTAAKRLANVAVSTTAAVIDLQAMFPLFYGKGYFLTIYNPHASTTV